MHSYGGKCENTLALHIRSTRGKWPLLGVEAKKYKPSQGIGHYFDRYTEFGEGTRLAMPKTICAPNSSSLKLGLGATKGVLD